MCWAAATVAAQAPPSAHGVRNDLPQPYRTTRDWGELPPGMSWPAVTAVEPAPDGTVFVVARCFANACTGRTEPPILKYNADGRLLATWGAGMFHFPHGATLDREARATCGSPTRAAATATAIRSSSSIRTARC